MSEASADSASQPDLYLVLGKHDLAAIVNELAEVASRWVLIGTCLGVDQSEIDEIEGLHLSQKEALLKVISRWLDSAQPHPQCWKDVTDALRQPVLKEERVAEKIEKNLCSRWFSRSLSSPSQVEENFALRVYGRDRSGSSPSDVRARRSKMQVQRSFPDHLVTCVPSVPSQSNGSVQTNPFLQPSQLTSSPLAPSTTTVQTQTTVTATSSNGSSNDTIAAPPSDDQSRVTGSDVCKHQYSKDHDEWTSVDKFIQSCMTSLPKINAEGIHVPSPNALSTKTSSTSSGNTSELSSTHSGSVSSSESSSTPSGFTSSSSVPSSTDSGRASSSSSSSQSIQLECEVFNGSNRRQIQCSRVSNKEVPPRYRDIKLRVKKFDTIPPCTPIFFRVRASEPCYVYIINKGSSGGLTTLIPNECDRNNRLERPEHFIQFPSSGADYEFELDQNCGTETIVVLAYSHAISDANQAEKDCEEILCEEKKEVFRDIKVVKKTSHHSICRGCIEVQFTVK